MARPPRPQAGLHWLHLDGKGARPKLGHLRDTLLWLENTLGTGSGRPTWGLVLELEDQWPLAHHPRVGLAFSAADPAGPDSQSEPDSGADSGLPPIPGASPSAESDWAGFLQFVDRVLGWPMIALIQTAGHAEFVLKHEAWRSFREVQTYAQCWDCSGRSSSVYEWLQAYASAVVEYVQDTVGVPLFALHLGGDEVWQLGQGPASQAECLARACQPIDLYLDHLTRLARYLHARYPTLRLLFWDDMLRSVPLAQLLPRRASLCRLEPVVWQYTPQLNLSHLWPKYDQLFSRIWAGSAFKGATASCAKVPLLQHHIQNHLSWHAEIREAVPAAKFQGLIFTGWARFDHFSALCELWPVGLPSLVCCHRAFVRGAFTEPDRVDCSRLIGLPAEVPLVTHTCPSVPHPAQDWPLTFPGGSVFLLMNEFVVLEHEIQTFLASDALATWFSPFHQAHPRRVSNLHVSPLLSQCSNLKSRLDSWWPTFNRAARPILFDQDRQEWKMSFVDGPLDRLTDLSRKMTHCLNLVR
ncbi:hypothetical protein TCAL_05155 [Tigriopus californicus]|uniref:Beta-N-acetylhexosaminidase n=2 Tax=Tigriopus californicus TaxID=6832 RepID=A0A553NNS0_TIGCA|nr:hypothetical protein TCAL_05155 [Tigriopus californicus]|eukprot:TCALIF_05155-PA protein Name:"Similar to Hexdc Hexosaminidase D (Mus musculus)" AED:0.01 eAED:0.01 QI:0/-1/0/1/-1/1/1/0/524